MPPSFPVEPLRTLARKLLPTQHYGPLLGHLFDRQFHEVALGQPPDEEMVGRWGTWRRGACVSFEPTHRGYGQRKYDAVLHGLPLFVETGTFRDACYHYINSPVLFGRVLQVTASPISPLYLPYISPISPLYLPLAKKKEREANPNPNPNPNPQPQP